MASHITPETFSPNSSSATSAVATISKLFSSDTLAELARESPSIRQIGARISSAIIASTYGSSLRVSGGSPRPQPHRRIADMPTPAPKYSSPAINAAST